MQGHVLLPDRKQISLHLPSCFSPAIALRGAIAVPTGIQETERAPGCDRPRMALEKIGGL